MQRCLFWLGLLVVVGCSKGDGTDASARKVNGMVPPIHPATRVVDTTPEQPVEPSYQGKPLSVWIDQFNQTENANERTQAGAALAQLGPEGFKPLLQALQSKSDDSRILALQSVTKEGLTTHEAETLPLLRAMLADPNPTIRKQATERLSWYSVKNLNQLKETVRLLRQVAESDPLPEVREVAKGALNSITTAVTGRPVAGAPDDPKLPF